MSIHDGHRKRLRQRFLQEGLEHFTDVQVLELVLFYAISRQDTNPIAHALLDRFGSLSQVLEASPEELMKVPGVGENAALLLTLIPQMGRFYMVDRSSRVTILQTLEQCANFLVPHFFGRKVETVFILCLDAKCKLLCCKELGEGGHNSTGVYIRKIVETAIGVNAATVVLAHNHPSGIALPSDDDCAATTRAAQALQTIGVALADHIIVADDDFVSMAQSGYLTSWEHL